MFFHRSHGQGSKSSPLLLMLALLAAASCSGGGSGSNNDTASTGGAATVGGAGSGTGGSGNTSSTGGATSLVAGTQVQPVCNTADTSIATHCAGLSGASYDYCCNLWSLVDACRAAGILIDNPNPTPSMLADYYSFATNAYKAAAQTFVNSGKTTKVTSWADVVTVLGNSNVVTDFCQNVANATISSANDSNYGMGSSGAS